jgi:polyhydroxyalkanoate synthesis regulator protein
VPHYLEATMDNFRANQRKLQESWEASTGPESFAQFAEHNMTMFQAGARACQGPIDSPVHGREQSTWRSGWDSNPR